MIEENELPAGWVPSNLEEVCLIERGITFPALAKSNESKTENIACLRTTNVQTLVNWQNLIYVPESYVKNDSKLVRQNDILISMANSKELVGKVSFVKEVEVKSTFGGFIAAIRTHAAVDSKYLFYYLRTENTQRQLRQSSSQTVNIANLSLDAVYSTTIAVAPFAEQHRIVEAIEQQFSRLDAGIASLKQAQKKLKLYRASILKAAVEGELTAEWRASHPSVEPASQLLARILEERRAKWEEEQRAKGKDSRGIRYPELSVPDVTELLELPGEWCWATTDQISQIQGGIQKQPKRMPKVNAFPYLRVANVFRGYLDLANVEKMELFGDELDKLRLVMGDILVVEGNGSKSEIGRCAVWKNEILDCVHQNHIIRLRLNSISPQYFAFYWNSPLGSQRIIKVAASTSGLYTLSTNKVSVIPVPLPPLAEQEQIVSLVEEQLSIIGQLESDIHRGLKRAERMRQSILHRAFTGRLVAQDPDDEPASALLERIRQGREEKQPMKPGTHKAQGQARAEKAARTPSGPRVPQEQAGPIDVEHIVQPDLWQSVEAEI